MKNFKHVLSLLILLTLSIQGVLGQVLTEDFEGVFPPTDWTLSNTGGNAWGKNYSKVF